MPIIDPDGYFGGDRFDMVSDSARLVWPSFFLASNTVARIELNYYKVIAKAFYKFKKKPTEGQFWAWVQEFRDAYLLFVYETEDGQVWGQWDTSEKFLVRHKLAVDLRSPAPIVKDFLDWKNTYISTKKAKSIVPINFGNLAQVPASLRGNVRGVGVGVGGGGGNGEEKEKREEAQAPPAPTPALEVVKQVKGSRFTLRPFPEEWAKWAIAERQWTTQKAQEVYDDFSDYWISRAGKEATHIDWTATWRRWVRKERDPPKSGQFNFQPQESHTDRAIRIGHERIRETGRL